MLEILRKMFEANPEKSTIVINAKCSDCGREVTIHITPASGGFGLQGGALFKCSVDRYLVKCPDCYQAKPRIISLKVPDNDLIYKPQRCKSRGLPASIVDAPTVK